jgi:hypothetical protein
MRCVSRAPSLPLSLSCGADEAGTLLISVDVLERQEAQVVDAESAGRVDHGDARVVGREAEGQGDIGRRWR